MKSPMPGKHTYRFLPLSHKPTAGAMGFQKHSKDPYEVSYSTKNSKEPPVELANLPKRSPSRIAADVVDNSIYRHKKEEKLKRKRMRKLILVGVAAGVFLLLLIVVIVVSVILTRGGVGAVPIGLQTPAGIGSVLHFNRSDNSSYEQTVEAIDDFLNGYWKMNINQGGLACTSGSPPAPTKLNMTGNMTTTTSMPTTCPQTARPFKVSFLTKTQCTKENMYGYKSGMPCVPLVLRVPSDWDARACVNANANVKDDNVKDDGSQEGVNTTTTTTTTTPMPAPEDIPVTCIQVLVPQPGNQTQEEIKLKVHPVAGFPVSGLADRGLPKYMDPVVMVQVTDTGTPGREVEFECSVCPGYKDRKEYSKHFKLKVD